MDSILFLYEFSYVVLIVLKETTINFNVSEVLDVKGGRMGEDAGEKCAGRMCVQPPRPFAHCNRQLSYFRENLSRTSIHKALPISRLYGRGLNL